MYEEIQQKKLDTLVVWLPEPLCIAKQKIPTILIKLRWLVELLLTFTFWMGIVWGELSEAI